MRNFILGVVVTVLVLVLGGLGLAMLGFIPTNANVSPPRLEKRIANGAVDASMERHAPMSPIHCPQPIRISKTE